MVVVLVTHRHFKFRTLRAQQKQQLILTDLSRRLFQIVKDDAVKVLHSLCQQICKTQQWSQNWKRSVFIPISKKGNAKKCSNYRTIALISRQWHPTSVLLPGESHGRRSLVGCSPWGHQSWPRLSDFTFTFHFHALEKELAPHSSVLAWRIPGMGKPGGLQSMGSLESDTTERLHFHFSLSCIGEGTGTPLQCSCLENPRDGEA